ncbi:MAG: uroporphyrinogen-III C-methyltransferase [Hydrogenophilales bacterium]|nr:uroporphyrinogen-III C-methyltransferase [Hydrogenophilales bacterium]
MAEPDGIDPRAPEAVVPAGSGQARHDWPAYLALLVALFAVMVAGFAFWQMQSRLRDIELQLARRIGEFDVSAREARSAAKEARATTDDLLARIAALETKAQDAQNQQLALAAMYQDMARSQDDRMIADIEQGLLLAQQQLHLAGNVRAAIAGLESIDARLATLRKPQFARLREAVAWDAAQLRLLPAADVVGINARLDAMIQNVDALKLDSDPAPIEKPPARQLPGMSWLDRWRDDAWGEIKQLIRIRRMDHPDLPLLAPNQAYFLRQNLKLRLLAARLSLLQRDETSFRGDLAAAEKWLTTYFNTHDALSQTLQGNLRTLATLPVAHKDMDIQLSLKALKAIRGEVP